MLERIQNTRACFSLPAIYPHLFFVYNSRSTSEQHKRFIRIANEFSFDLNLSGQCCELTIALRDRIVKINLYQKKIFSSIWMTFDERTIRDISRACMRLSNRLMVKWIIVWKSYTKYFFRLLYRVFMDFHWNWKLQSGFGAFRISPKKKIRHDINKYISCLCVWVNILV